MSLIDVKVSLDALNLALKKIPFKTQKELSESIAKLASEQADKYKVPTFRVLKSNIAYEQVLFLPLCDEYVYARPNPETPFMVISTSPNVSSRPPMLISIKGHPLNTEEYMFARFWLRYIARNVSDRTFLAADNFAVTMYHLAFDIEGKITDFGVERLNTSEVMIFFSKGKYTGANLGSARSKNRATCYSRNAKKRNNHLDNSELDVTRIEEKVSVTDSLTNLPSLIKETMNMYSIRVYDIQSMLAKEEFDPITKNCITNLGIHTVIAAQLDSSEKRRFRKQLQPYVIDLNISQASKTSLKQTLKNVKLLYRICGSKTLKTIRSNKEVFNALFID